VAWRATLATSWPPLARPNDADEVFPEGWHAAAREAARDPGAARKRVASLDVEEQRLFEESLASVRERAALVAGRIRPAPEPLPDQVSVTSLIDYGRCPKLFYWSVVRPLPRRPSAAARLGSDIHRWIELRSRGQMTLLDTDDMPDLTIEERQGRPSLEMRLRETWDASRFAGRTPLYAERPFLLVVDGFAVGGRIDAIFDDEDGSWEIVDYKTGRRPDDADPVAGMQLDVYAVAAGDIWGKRAEDLTLTYFYLDSNEIVSRPSDPLDVVRARIRSTLAGIASRSFRATPGNQCRWCDFIAFCAPGRAWVRNGVKG
jgi:DNA helicase-2/ATP-dependent DNA helicase PcrA